MDIDHTPPDAPPAPPVTNDAPRTPPRDRPLATVASDIGHHHGWLHAAYVDAYGGDPNAEPEVPQQFATVATFYTAAYNDGVSDYADDSDDTTAHEPPPSYV